MTGLKIAPELTLPVDAVTGTFGILATKGAGKSNAAVVMAEEMYDAGVPWVAIDPKGDWWGLRSNAEGTGPGLPIVVFGGRHGDVPLEPTAGALLADLVLEQGLTCVLDVSQFTKADTTRFLLAFGRRLFAHADDGDGPEPLHLFLEEAHEYLPQVVKGDQADLVNVWQRIVKQGRFKGLGCTLISQRSSVLNKDVLELIDTLIVLRTIGPNSRKSIAGWVADQDVDTGLMASLPSLDDGEAWLWSPGALSILERIRFRRRRTFDSGATPKVGQKRRTPATLADVDLASIKEQMAETIEKAKADDPRELSAHRPGADHQTSLPSRPTATAGQPRPARTSAAGGTTARAATPPAGQGTTTAGDVQLRTGARRMVESLGRMAPLRLTKSQWGTVAKLKTSGGTWSTYLSEIRRAGFIDETSAGYTLTDAGFDYLGGRPDPMTAGELQDHYRQILRSGAVKMLDALIDQYPGGLTREELGAAAEIAVTGGTFSTYLSDLIRNGLAERADNQIVATDILMLGADQ